MDLQLDDEVVPLDVDLVECSVLNCFERVPKDQVIQPLVYEAMCLSGALKNPDLDGFLKYKDQPVCERCESECRRNWALLNCQCFGKLHGIDPFARDFVASSIQNFEKECRELQLHIKSTAPKLALLSNFADVVIENACKHNAKFATLYAKYLATKTNPIPAVLNPKNMCPGVGLYNDRMKMMLNEEDTKRFQVEVDEFILFATGTLQDPWTEGVLCEVVGDIFVVKDLNTRLLNQLPLKKLAKIGRPKEAVLRIGSRVLAKLSDGKFYSGIILYSEKGKGDAVLYQVHLDNGMTLDSLPKDIRVICSQAYTSAWKDVEKSEESYVRHCLTMYPNRLIINAKEGEHVSVYQGAECFSAEVFKVKFNYVVLKYETGKLEELHMGSPRFKLNRDTIVGTSNNQGRWVKVDMKNRIQGLSFVPHQCSPKCCTPDDGGDPMRFHYTFEKCKQYPTYAIPISLGWKRQELRTGTMSMVSYEAPCGRRLPSILSVQKYLNITKSNLEISFFTFDVHVRSLVMYEALNVRWKCNDYSNGLEKIPIPCVNSIDTDSVDSIYYALKNTILSGLHVETDENFLICCDCKDNCQNKLKCKCQLLTMTEHQHLRGRKGHKSVGYNNRILTEMVSSGIYECNPKCSCHLQLCYNRVVQLPIRNHLQIFKTESCGWGVRTLIDLPAGAFVCLYLGNLYRHSEAILIGSGRSGRYLADLDFIEVAESEKEGYEKNVPELELSETNSSSFEVEPSSDILLTKAAEDKIGACVGRSQSRVSRKRKAHEDAEDDYDPPPNSSRKYFGPSEYAYILDGMDCGNLGRFLNHACVPNLFVQNCFVDSHDVRYPRVAFFTSEYVAAGSELRWSYIFAEPSDDESDDPASKCTCRTSPCKMECSFPT